LPETPLSPLSEPQSKKNSKRTSKAQSAPSKTGKNSDPEKKLSSTSKRNLLDVLPSSEPDRTTQAIRRLGLKDKDISKITQLPPINKLLKEQSKSGISGAIEAMRMSDGDVSQTFLEKWDSVPERDRECLTIEIIALAAGVDPRALLGEILLAAREYSVVKFKLAALDAHPDILEKRIEYAKERGGYRDRDAIDTILGALPRSKTTFIDKFYAGSETPQGDLPESDSEEATKTITQAQEMVEDENFVFPDCEMMQEKIQPIRQKLLEEKR
jgi:hypothetical protein